MVSEPSTISIRSIPKTLVGVRISKVSNPLTPSMFISARTAYVKFTDSETSTSRG